MPKFRTPNNWFFVLFLWCYCTTIQGQNTLANSSDQVIFDRALSMYNFGQYNNAQTLFSTLENESSNPQISSNSAYYTTICAIRLNQSTAQNRVEEFIKIHSTSPKRNLIFLEAGDYYFNASKLAYAKKWYQQVDHKTLESAQQDRFFFNYGYSNYKTDNLKLAKTLFKRLEFSNTYGSQARYYLGFIAYKQDDYETASRLFQDDVVEQEYSEALGYFNADLNFKLGAFQKAIDIALEVLDTANPSETSELNKIIGESFFNLKQYEKAIPFLKRYNGKNGQWTHVDYYQLGYAYYKKNLFKEAIGEFNKIIGGNNALAQNAYYHLGECYIKNNQKQEAQNAFKIASELNYDLKIQEDAWLNYAKLSYDIGNPYVSTPQVLSAFLKTYPKSPFRQQIETLLVDSYISSGNYKNALELLSGNRDNALKSTFQKVAFLRALELYNQHEFSAAKTLFQKAISTNIDLEFTAKAQYWNAEIDYNQLDFNAALNGYLTFKLNPSAPQTEEYNQLAYNLGYTYFKLKRYPEAIAAFQAYCNIASKDDPTFNDALLRMADAHYVTRSYHKAIETYIRVVANNDVMSDYALFQAAVSHGFLGEIEAKILALMSVLEFKNSKYLDDVYFELANTYNTQNRPTKALLNYDKVISDFPQSSLLSKALLRKGLLLYNRSENPKALVALKQVAERYPATPEAYQAISSVRSLYVENGQVDAYAQWVGTLTYARDTDVKLEKTTFEAAEKQYLEKNTEKAIRLFNSYLQNFPNGSRQNKSHFYLAELYFNDGLIENALPHYESVIQQPNNELTETALQKTCVIRLAQSKEVIPFLKRLEQEAKNPQNTLYAQSNLMKLYFESESFDAALQYSDMVLNSARGKDAIKNNALAIKARSAMAQKNDSLAKLSYIKILQSNSSVFGAEATYHLAYFEHNETAFDASNRLIQNLIKNYPNQNQFAARGLVLMAQNFYALGDTFQATYILESVVKNFGTYKDITDSAKLLLKDYQQAIQKTNASIDLTPKTPTKTSNDSTDQNDD